MELLRRKKISEDVIEYFIIVSSKEVMVARITREHRNTQVDLTQYAYYNFNDLVSALMYFKVNVLGFFDNEKSHLLFEIDKIFEAIFRSTKKPLNYELGWKET